MLKRLEDSKKSRRLLPGLTVADGFMRHPFDVDNQVRTSGLIAGRHLQSGHPHDRHATAYYGVAPSVFQALLRRWQGTRPSAPLEETSFVDIGAGMGRALLLAAEMPFRRVDGVELNPTLVNIARRNLTAWRKAGRVQATARIHRGDAVEFAFPAGPCLVFLFNPFGGPVMRKLFTAMGKQFADRPAELDILYVNNEQERVLEQCKGYVRLFLGPVKRSRPDTVADHRILTNQPDGEYASSSYEDCSIWRWVGAR
ncbi:MAG TPA: class I SAM-dependent methyltransferase [Terracidiphilus sp.]|jgi:SAM-dependent methyltransferase